MRPNNSHAEAQRRRGTRLFPGLLCASAPMRENIGKAIGCHQVIQHFWPALLLANLVTTPIFSAESADLVLRGGNVVTMDDTRPEAEAIAVRGDKIVAVGAAKDVEPLIGTGTRVIDLAGKMAMP